MPKIKYLTTIGEFMDPTGVAVDSSGNVYVADLGNKNVQIFDGSGTFKAAITSGLQGPNDVAADSSGNIYVVDSSNVILKYDSSLTLVTHFGSFGPGNYDFNSPTGVTLDPSGEYVYVADNGNSRILKYNSGLNPTSSYVTQWPTSGFPSDVAVDDSGNVYVTETSNNRVQMFNSSGGYLAEWGSSGPHPGQFSQPTGVAVWNPFGWADQFVADFGNGRVEWFIEGDYSDQWDAKATPYSTFAPFHLATLPSGTLTGWIYVVDKANKVVEKFEAEITLKRGTGIFRL
jgi:tripartite motif-containing protein 71